MLELLSAGIKNLNLNSKQDEEKGSCIQSLDCAGKPKLNYAFQVIQLWKVREAITGNRRGKSGLFREEKTVYKVHKIQN
jgi:hypothetical protein